MKLFTYGGKYCSTSGKHSKVHTCCNTIFLHKWIISLSHKQSYDNSIIFLYFVMKMLDNFHIPLMVMAPWVDYGKYPTPESHNRRKIKTNVFTNQRFWNFHSMRLSRKLHFFSDFRPECQQSIKLHLLICLREIRANSSRVHVFSGRLNFTWKLSWKRYSKIESAERDSLFQ